MALFHVVKRFCNYGAKRLTLLILHVGGFEMTNSLASKLSFNMQPYICFIGLGGGCCAHIEGKSTFVCCPPAGWLPSKGNKHLEAKFKFCSCCSCILCLPRYVGGWISQLAAWGLKKVWARKKNELLGQPLGWGKLSIHFYTCVNIAKRKHLDIVYISKYVNVNIGQQCKARAPPGPHRSYWPGTPFLFWKQLPAKSPVRQSSNNFHSSSSHLQCHQNVGKEVWRRYCEKPNDFSFTGRRKLNSPLSAASWLPRLRARVSASPGSLSPRQWSAHAARRSSAPSLASRGSAPPAQTQLG